MDILLANDSIPEFLFHNKGNGTFEEVGVVSGLGLDGNGTTFAGMGVDFEDCSTMRAEKPKRLLVPVLTIVQATTYWGEFITELAKAIWLASNFASRSN